jgi:hypothetical protein
MSTDTDDETGASEDYPEQFRPTITVRKDDFRTALKHGMELWWDDSSPHKRLDDRGGRTGFTRFVNARIEGKFGEVAFRDWLYQAYDIQAGVDWRIYGDYEQTDFGDLQYLIGRDNEVYEPAVEFDVKKTKPWNSWLAIRARMFRQHPDDAPYLLTKLALEDDLVLDAWADEGSWPGEDAEFHLAVEDYCDEHLPVEVELCGAVYPHEFTVSFDAGDRLYDPDNPSRKLGDPLKEDNEAIPVQELPSSPSRWDRVVEDIVGDNPIDYTPLRGDAS